MATQAATQATQDALRACDGHNTSALLAGSNFEEEVGALSHITPSQPSTSQITRPEPEPDDVFGFRIADADAFTFEKREDTATKLIEAARLAESRAEFLKAMFSGDLFAGMMDEDDIYKQCKANLFQSMMIPARAESWRRDMTSQRRRSHSSLINELPRTYA